MNESAHILVVDDDREIRTLLAEYRTQLMDLMRGRDLDPFDRSIDVRVSRLRQILHDDVRSPRALRVEPER